MKPNFREWYNSQSLKGEKLAFNAWQAGQRYEREELYELAKKRRDRTTDNSGEWEMCEMMSDIAKRGGI